MWWNCKSHGTVKQTRKSPVTYRTHTNTHSQRLLQRSGASYSDIRASFWGNCMNLDRLNVTVSLWNCWEENGKNKKCFDNLTHQQGVERISRYVQLWEDRGKKRSPLFKSRLFVCLMRMEWDFLPLLETRRRIDGGRLGGQCQPWHPFPGGARLHFQQQLPPLSARSQAKLRLKFHLICCKTWVSAT